MPGEKCGIYGRRDGPRGSISAASYAAGEYTITIDGTGDPGCAPDTVILTYTSASEVRAYSLTVHDAGRLAGALGHALGSTIPG